MKFHVQQFSLAAAITMVIVYLICTLFVAVAPGTALQLAGQMMHMMNIQQTVGGLQLTALDVVSGVVQAFVYTYVGALIFASLYNGMTKNKSR